MEGPQIMKGTLDTQYDAIINYSYGIFRDKLADYGPNWLLLRPASLVDDIWRKVRRIRTLEEHGGVRKIDEGRDVEFVGGINYSLIYLIQHSGFPGIPSAEEVLRDLSVLDRIRTQDILDAYQKAAAQVKELLLKKNFDYGDAWKSMEPCSLTDQVVVRVCRVKSLLAKGGAKVSDGVDAQLMDIINFSVFALIRMDSPLFGI